MSPGSTTQRHPLFYSQARTHDGQGVSVGSTAHVNLVGDKELAQSAQPRDIWSSIERSDLPCLKTLGKGYADTESSRPLRSASCLVAVIAIKAANVVVWAGTRRLPTPRIPSPNQPKETTTLLIQRLVEARFDTGLDTFSTVKH